MTSLQTIPETYKNTDWPRKVKQAIDQQNKAITAMPSRAKLRFVAP